MMNNVLSVIAASDKMSDDGEMASVMGFSGFGTYSPTLIVNNHLFPTQQNDNMCCQLLI